MRIKIKLSLMSLDLVELDKANKLIAAILFSP